VAAENRLDRFRLTVKVASKLHFFVPDGRKAAQCSLEVPLQLSAHAVELNSDIAKQRLARTRPAAIQRSEHAYRRQGIQEGTPIQEASKE
jgi:hypothetical protein